MVALTFALGVVSGITMSFQFGTNWPGFMMDIWSAAAATNSLVFTLAGVLITLPLILGYTVFVYRVFHGKKTEPG